MQPPAQLIAEVDNCGFTTYIFKTKIGRQVVEWPSHREAHTFLCPRCEELMVSAIRNEEQVYNKHLHDKHDTLVL